MAEIKIEITWANEKIEIKNGECIGIYGPTGSGKTTLFNKILADYSPKYKISYVFQDNKLITHLTVLKNVMLPLESKMDKNEAEKKARGWLQELDLVEKVGSQCNKLSGGEKQRVNLARAFAFDGDIFLFDEAFTAQDEKHKKQIFELVKQLKTTKKTILIISHNKQDLEELCEKIL